MSADLYLKDNQIMLLQCIILLTSSFMAGLMCALADAHTARVMGPKPHALLPDGIRL